MIVLPMFAITMDTTRHAMPPTTLSKDQQSMSVRCHRCQRKYRRPVAQMQRIFCRHCEDQPWSGTGKG